MDFQYLGFDFSVSQNQFRARCRDFIWSSLTQKLTVRKGCWLAVQWNINNLLLIAWSFNISQEITFARISSCPCRNETEMERPEKYCQNFFEVKNWFWLKLQTAFLTLLLIQFCSCWGFELIFSFFLLVSKNTLLGKKKKKIVVQYGFWKCTFRSSLLTNDKQKY